VSPTLDKAKVSYNVREAAAASGYSVDTIWRAINAGELTPRYRTSRPVIEADELTAWIHTAPTEPPKRKAN
jgi:predicted DNA-binding transcriptional regulator AlpA